MPVVDYDYNYDVNALDIEKYLKGRRAGPGVNLFEMGIAGRRVDLIHINPHKQHIRIFEIKSSRSDFTGDHKWQKYLKYCHTFSFVCPYGLIQKNDVPPGIGILWIYKWKHKKQIVWSKEVQWHLEQTWIKRPKRREMDSNTMVHVAFLMVERMISRKHDVF
ncbi:unnamed protein product [marine sediment metagenome]|uniref:DNA repair protein MmcB-related protein n=1 Tax=marine sediment metagenome TaxID=412755 RepID=X1J7Y4_9ZZZZ